jgi:hypothetical protein
MGKFDGRMKGRYGGRMLSYGRFGDQTFGLPRAVAEAAASAPTSNNVVGGDATGAGATDTLLASYTPTSGSNAKLIVGVITENLGTDITAFAVDFDGDAMTLIDSEQDANPINHAWLFYLDNPGTSAGNITIDTLTGPASADFSTVAVTLLGAASGAAEASNTQATATSPITTGITTVANNALILSLLSSGDVDVPSAEGSETELHKREFSSAYLGLSEKVDVVAGSESMQWTQATPNRLVHVVASIAPA